MILLFSCQCRESVLRSLLSLKFADAKNAPAELRRTYHMKFSGRARYNIFLAIFSKHQQLENLKNWPIFSRFNPSHILRRQQTTVNSFSVCGEIVLKTKLEHYFWDSIDAKTSFSFLNACYNSVEARWSSRLARWISDLEPSLSSCCFLIQETLFHIVSFHPGV